MKQYPTPNWIIEEQNRINVYCEEQYVSVLGDKIVDAQTADKLINGKIEIGLGGIPKRVKLSRNFKKVS